MRRAAQLLACRRQNFLTFASPSAALRIAMTYSSPSRAPFTPAFLRGRHYSSLRYLQGKTMTNLSDTRSCEGNKIRQPPKLFMRLLEK